MSDDENKVTIPHDLTNEMIVLAAALVDKGVRDVYVPKIPVDHFVDSEHQLIWKACKEILRRKKGFDLQKLHRRVSGKVKLSFLKDLMNRYPKAPVSISEHITALQWDSVRVRAVGDQVPSFLRLLKDPTETPAAVRAAAERVSRAFDVKLAREFMSNARLLADSQAEEIRMRRNIACFEYGLKELDYFEDGTHRCIPGAAPGKITNITGVSGSGKSVLAAYIGLMQARQNRRVLYGAWEMGQGDTLEAMANISLQTNPIKGLTGSRYDTATGQLHGKRLRAFGNRMRKIGQAVRFFDAPFSQEPERRVTNEDVLAELYRMIVDSGCEVIVYDLFERCLADGSPGAERRALFGLQSLHKNTGTHGIIVSQQKLKEVEARPDKRPTRNTILGSQAWVDISDTIIGVHRPALFKPVQDDTMELLILKQRFGKWPMAIQFQWNGELMRIDAGEEIEFEAIDSTQGALFR